MQHIVRIHADALCRMTEWNQQVAGFRHMIRQTQQRQPIDRVSYATRVRRAQRDDNSRSIVELDTALHAAMATVDSTRDAQDAYRRLVAHHAPDMLPLLPSDWNDRCGDIEVSSTSDISSTSEHQNINTSSGPMFESLTSKHRSRQSTAVRKDRGDTLHQRRGSFRTALQHYQGKGSNPVPDRIVSFITQRLKANKRNITDASRAHVASILRSSRRPSFSRYYRDISHIHATITGQAPPDVSRYETELMLMFDSGFFLPFFNSMSSINCAICLIATTMASRCFVTMRSVQIRTNVASSFSPTCRNPQAINGHRMHECWLG